MDLQIIDAIESDFVEIQKIYAYYVEKTTISLEEIAPSVEELCLRWENSHDKSLPFLIAKFDNRVVGFAYAFPYRVRSAYRFTVEESVYVSKDFHGRGIGRQLLKELMDQCKNKGYKQMLAVIAGSNNATSIEFHRHMGFKKAGILEKFGFKFDAWVDTLLMQKEL